mgnify:CR=1 FL=1
MFESKKELLIDRKTWAIYWKSNSKIIDDELELMEKNLTTYFN